MPLVVRAFPLRRPVSEVEEFADALMGPKRSETDAFYKQYGVAHESWHLQATDYGTWVIGVTWVESPDDAAPRYAAASEEFHTWFKDSIVHLTGVDPNVSPLGPPTRQLFSWSAGDSDEVPAAAAATW